MSPMVAVFYDGADEGNQLGAGKDHFRCWATLTLMIIYLNQNEERTKEEDEEHKERGSNKYWRKEDECNNAVW